MTDEPGLLLPALAAWRLQNVSMCPPDDAPALSPAVARWSITWQHHAAFAEAAERGAGAFVVSLLKLHPCHTGQ